MSNPLLADGLPRFDAIRPEHVTPALDVLLADAEAALERAVSDAVPAMFDAVSAVLDVAVERLHAAWSAVAHLQAVADTPALRAAFGDNLPRMAAFDARLGADQRLYAKFKVIAASPAAATLKAEQRRALDNALRDFVTGGAELQGAARERFTAIQERLAALSQAFGEHVLDATDGFELLVGPERLAGVPEDVRAATRADAAARGQDGHRLTLHQPVYAPLMQEADDRALREALYRAHATRASEFGAQALDNTALMHEMLALRQEQAALLGHASYAQLSLVPKMAESPAQVLAFLSDLAQRARPQALAERQALADFAARELGLPELQPWDRAWASEKLSQSLYAFSSDALRPYFPLPRVLAGLFELLETLFDLRIRRREAAVWHESVTYHDVERDGRVFAGFYLDLHARPGKDGGAWMDDARTRWRRPGGALQLPVAHLVCNFAAPRHAQPALLTHDDVITLFHEFGHGLHHMLTQVDEHAVAGTAGVEWDAVELPSQFMENFCWEWPVLSRLSGHAASGEPLPRALFDRLRASRNFQSGLRMLRQVEYSLLDLRLHLDDAAAVADVAAAVRAEVAVDPAPPWQRFAHSFTHVFDGSYAAGYYSYAWAEVLSADAFSAFEDTGLFDPATGRRWREAVLEVGGSRPALQSFMAFRGREPRIEALLRHRGLA